MGTKGKNYPKIVVILGPTASGKSDLAVDLALKFNGEVVSADSRQVYKGMDIGTGKITKEEAQGVPHHLLDIASPKRRFTASQFQKKGRKTILEIIKRGNLPIICGGTAFYISALVDNISFPEVTPDWNLRKKLEKENTKKLFLILEKLDKKRAKDIDPNNRRRLIRAIEIVQKTKKPVPKIKKKPLYDPLYLGIKIKQEELDKKIDKRLEKRLRQGMIEEVKALKNQGISWQKIESFGLEYKWTALYLQNKTSYNEAKTRLSTDIKRFSKRQMTWWKHDKRIKWIKTNGEAQIATKNFLS